MLCPIIAIIGVEINMKRAALYSRVSTLEQANNGYSLSAQKEQLENYANAMGYKIVDQYSDGGHSGGNIKRPAMQRLINDVNQSKVDIVIVVKLDRLSRNQRNTLYLIEEVFHKNKVGFISLQESFDTTTSFGRAMVGIISTFAQLERDTITERLFMGRVERAKNGLYSGHPNVPTGYTYKDDRLYPNDDSKLVQEIFERFADGESAYSIYSDLAKRYPQKIYGANMITAILDNPIYIGKVTFDGEIYDGIHDPIIDDKTFNVVKNRRNNLSDKYRVDRTKRASLLARKLYCGRCGKTLILQRHYSKYDGKFKQSEYHYGYYVCNGKRPNHYKKTGVKCTEPNKKVEDINDIIFDKINALNFNQAKNIVRKVKKDTTQEKKVALDKQENRLMDLYQLGSIDLDEIDARLKSINKQRAELNEAKQPDRNDVKILETLKSLQSVDIRTLPFKEQCDIVDTLIDRITVKDDEMTIVFNF